MTPNSAGSNQFGSPHSIGDPTESESQSIILTKVESEPEPHKPLGQLKFPIGITSQGFTYAFLDHVKQANSTPEPTIMTDIQPQRPRLLLQHSSGETTYIEDGDPLAEILAKQSYPSLRNFSFKFDAQNNENIVGDMNSINGHIQTKKPIIQSVPTHAPHPQVNSKLLQYKDLASNNWIASAVMFKDVVVDSH